MNTPHHTAAMRTDEERDAFEQTAKSILRLTNYRSPKNKSEINELAQLAGKLAAYYLSIADERARSPSVGAISTGIANVEFALSQLNDALGCFAAAEVEGLYQALGEVEDNSLGSLKDLLTRRILYAPPAIQTAISALQKVNSVEQTRQMADWQPIETAPRDGSPITVAMSVRWLPYKPQARKQGLPEGRWQSANGHGGWDNMGWEPTYWTSSPAQAVQPTDSHP